MESTPSKLQCYSDTFSSPIWEKYVSGISCYDIFDDGKYIVYSNIPGTAYLIHLLNADNGEEIWSYNTTIEKYGIEVSISQDGSRIFYHNLYTGGKFGVIDRTNNETLWTKTSPLGYPLSGKISKDGSTLIFGALNPDPTFVVIVFDAQTGDLLNTISDLSGIAYDMSADGNSILIGSRASDHKSLRLYSQNSSSAIWEIATGYYYVLGISYDGRTGVVSEEGSGDLIIYDPITQNVIGRYYENIGSVWICGISGNGQTVYIIDSSMLKYYRSNIHQEVLR